MKVNVFILKILMIIIVFGFVSCSDDSKDNSQMSEQGNGQVEEKVFLGDIVLRTQEEVNVFGAENYTRITGSITFAPIGSPPNSINDLSSLSSITSVGGDFNLWINNSLLNLNGLQNLERIEGFQVVIEGSMILNLDGLESLNYVENIMSINGNSIENINGLSNLTSVRSLGLVHTNIENLNGLSSLTNVENIGLGDSDNLINLSGLTNLTNLERIGLERNNNLINLNGLTNLTNVERIYIVDNENFKNLNGLDNLTSRLVRIHIEGNPLLDDFCNLEYVFNNYGLPDSYVVFDNAYNPTLQDIIDGNCSL